MGSGPPTHFSLCEPHSQSPHLLLSGVKHFIFMEVELIGQQKAKDNEESSAECAGITPWRAWKYHRGVGKGGEVLLPGTKYTQTSSAPRGSLPEHGPRPQEPQPQERGPGPHSMGLPEALLTGTFCAAPLASTHKMPVAPQVVTTQMSSDTAQCPSENSVTVSAARQQSGMGCGFFQPKERAVHTGRPRSGALDREEVVSETQKQRVTNAQPCILCNSLRPT